MKFLVVKSGKIFMRKHSEKFFFSNLLKTSPDIELDATGRKGTPRDPGKTMFCENIRGKIGMSSRFYLPAGPPLGRI